MLMPKLLKDVRLGMTLDELKAVRTGIEDARDVEGADSYIERIPDSPFFHEAKYVFSGDRLALVKLSLSTANYATIWRYRPRLIYGALLKWGKISERQVLTVHGLESSGPGAEAVPLQHPLLVWKKQDAFVTVSYTPSKALDGKPWLESVGPDATPEYFLSANILSAPWKNQWMLPDGKIEEAAEVEGSTFLFFDVDQILAASAVALDGEPFE